MTTTAHDLTESARAAGRAGRDWSDWQCDDAVQSFLDGNPLPDVDAWEAAYTEGVIARRLAPTADGGAGWLTRWTTAPADYDTFGTMSLSSAETGEWHGRVLRHVLIDPHNLAYQEARYGSGLHGSWERDPREEEREHADRAARLRADREEREALRAAALEWLQGASLAEIEALEDADTVEARGLSYGDLRDERQRRADAAAEAGRAATWDRCRAAFVDGAILVDDGTAGERGVYGWIKGRDPHVYYACRVTNDWRKVADDATVQGSSGDVVGSLAYVADWLASGRLRIVAADDVPPEPVMRRLGLDRLRETRRFSAGSRTVWTGRARGGWEILVLDEKGHLVRGKALREAAVSAHQSAE